MMNNGIYGQYNVEVIKSGTNESYFPFGTGYQKNLILDDFFEKILLNGWKHSSQAFMQTCITNTGSNQPTRFDTTGTFKYGDGPAFNDRTWASTVFNFGVVPSENRIWMSRDFLFNAVAGSNQTYREAMVGLFFESSSNQASNIDSDIALSHFVFPQDVVVPVGDRLKINYTINFVIDYLSQTGAPITLNGNGYNFDGKVFIKTNDVGIFSVINPTNTYFTYNSMFNSMGYNLYKNIASNTNTYSQGSLNSTYPATFNLFGTQSYNGVGFFTNGFVTGTYPSRYSASTIAGSVATLTKQNYQVGDNGASIDIDYYFPPLGTQRSNVSGILLSRYSDPETNNPYACIYLLFDQPQNILANEPISMKLRWSIKRL